MELTSKLHTLPWQRQLLELAVDLYSKLSDFSFIAKAYLVTHWRRFVTGFNFNFTLVFTTGNVAKWLSHWAHNPKDRGSKSRNAFFFWSEYYDSKFNGMIEYFHYYRQLAFFFFLLTRKKLITNTCYFNYEKIYIYMAKNKLNLSQKKQNKTKQTNKQT